MIRAIIFDLDDTLYPEETYVVSGFRAVSGYMAQRSGLDPGSLFADLWHEYRKSSVGVFDRLLQRHPQLELTVMDLVTVYRNHFPTIQLSDDVVQLLNTLRGTYGLGLISDGHLTVQQRKVEALGLSKWIEKICLTDQWGRDYWKPHPRSFEHVLKEFSVNPGEACYVGDNLRKDFVAPNLLGMHSACLRTTNGVYAGVEAPAGGMPEVFVDDLSELIQIMAKWNCVR